MDAAKRKTNTDPSTGGYSNNDFYAESNAYVVILDRTLFEAGKIIEDIKNKQGFFSGSSPGDHTSQEESRFTDFVNGTLGHETAHVASKRIGLEEECYERGFLYEARIRGKIVNHTMSGMGVVIYIKYEERTLNKSEPNYNSMRLDLQRNRAIEEYGE